MFTFNHRWSLGVTRGLAAFVLCLGVGLAAQASAQSRPPSRPSATVAIHQIQVAFIGSGMLGGGSLNYRRATYRFRLGGLGIGGVGVSRLDATGSVYNLRNLADFEGVYGQVRSGWAAGDQGRGTLDAKCKRRLSAAGGRTPRAFTDDGSGWRAHR